MICPRCGLPIEPDAVSWCPRCGQPLHAPGASAVPEAPEQVLGAPPGAAGSASIPLYPVYPASPPPPPYAPPSYGAPAPPSYGPGYPPPPGPMHGSGYGPIHDAPPWAPPGMYPPPPPPKRGEGPNDMLIVAGVMALVVVLIAAIAGGSALALRQRTTAQAPTPPPATPTVTPIMPGWSGYNPLVNDPLTGYASDWPDDTHCFVRTDGYHIKDGYFCYPGGSDVGDATTSVRAELFAGPLDMLYGIAFRIVNQPHHFAFYFFGVSADGDWTFGRQEGDTWIPIVALQPSATIQVGPHVFTTLTVNATGSHFVFYVGRTQIGSADDPKLAEGYSGLTIYGNGEAVFTNFLVGV